MFFKRKSFNDLLEEYYSQSDAYLIDVREEDEYAEGRVPGSINIPLSKLEMIKDVVKDKDAPLYVYCLGGKRSANAVSQMKSWGYTKVINIGGINSYKGEIEK